MRHETRGLEQRSHTAIITQRCPISGELIPRGNEQYVVLDEVSAEGKTTGRRRAFCFAEGINVPDMVELDGRLWSSNERNSDDTALRQ